MGKHKGKHMAKKRGDTSSSSSSSSSGSDSDESGSDNSDRDSDSTEDSDSSASSSSDEESSLKRLRSKKRETAKRFTRSKEANGNAIQLPLAKFDPQNAAPGTVDHGVTKWVRHFKTELHNAERLHHQQ